jgi:plastocyanin
MRRLDSGVVLVLLLVGPIFLAAGGSWAASGAPGYGAALYDNAPPSCPSPDGFAATDWEWRPLYVSNRDTFEMPHNPSLVANLNYVQSSAKWEQHLATTAPWTNGSVFEYGSPPSGFWRKYNTTLYQQLNGSPVPNPNLATGSFNAPDYYYQRYAWGGTLSANDLPSNWYLDPLRRWVVLSAAMSMDGFGSWALFDDLGGLYYFEDDEGGQARTLSCGAQMGAGGAAFFGAMLACEYLLVIAYDNHVIGLDEAARLYRASRRPTRDDYYSVDDPSLGRRVIVRRKVPNYTVPSGASSSVAPARNTVGSVGLTTDALTVPTSTLATRTKTVTFNETFTTASIPFQFTLEPSCTAGASPTSQYRGRAYLRLHVAGAPQTADGWRIVPIAGVKEDQWLNPWTYLTQRDGVSSWTSTAENNTSVSTSFATEGTKQVAFGWRGQVLLRAHDMGVSHFDKMELTAELTATGAAADEQTSAQAWLTVQPAFTANIAEAGPWRTVSPGQSVSFTADTSRLPENQQSVSYTWDFGDGTPRTGSSVSYTFPQAGVYDVLLTVDPQVPDAAPNANLFNDSTGGRSYDICRVSVGQPTNPGGSSNPTAVDFSSVRVVASAGQIVAQFTTDKAATGRLSWCTLPPAFAGPPSLTQAGVVSDLVPVTTHGLTLTGVTAGMPYYLKISAQPDSGGTSSAQYNLADDWALVTPLASASSVDLSSSAPTITPSAPVFQSTPTSVHVTWTTDVPTTTRVQWSDRTMSPPSSSSQGGNLEDATTSTNHDMTVTGLTVGKTYYFYLSGVKQPGTGHVYLRNAANRNSSQSPYAWAVTTPTNYESGSRASAGPRVEYLTAQTTSSGALSVRASLTEPAEVRLLHRAYGTTPWTQGDWLSETASPTWSLSVPAGAHELVVELKIGDRTVLSRPFVAICTGPATGETARYSLLSRTVKSKDGQKVTLPRAFSTPPILVLSAVEGRAPLAACAVNNSGRGFTVSALRADGQPALAATLSYLAFSPAAGNTSLQGNVAQLSSGAKVKFTTPFALPPVIVCNAQKGGKAILAAAVDNRVDGFTLYLNDLSGKAVTGAWVQWIAVAAPVTVQVSDRDSARLEGGVQSVGDGVMLPVGVPVRDRGAAVMSAQTGTKPLLCGPRSLTADATTAAIWRTGGQPLTGSAWLQWLVVNSQRGR